MITATALSIDANVEAWFDKVVARLSAAGLKVIHRLPNPLDLPIVVYYGDEDEDLADFFDVLTALNVRVAFAELTITDVDDLCVLRERLRRVRERQGGYLGETDEDESLLAPLAEQLGAASAAQVVVVCGGVAHLLRVPASWFVDAHMTVEVMEMALDHDDGHVDLEAERACAQEDADAADVIDRITCALDGLEQRLSADDHFHAEGTSENSRRRYAQADVRQHARVNELPQGVRGAIASAAEAAWTSWRLTGQPKRQAQLARCVVELVSDPSLTGTLEQRRRAARALLVEIDSLAVTAEVVDKLARASAETQVESWSHTEDW